MRGRDSDRCRLCGRRERWNAGLRKAMPGKPNRSVFGERQGHEPGAALLRTGRTSRGDRETPRHPVVQVRPCSRQAARRQEQASRRGVLKPLRRSSEGASQLSCMRAATASSSSSQSRSNRAASSTISSMRLRLRLRKRRVEAVLFASDSPVAREDGLNGDRSCILHARA